MLLYVVGVVVLGLLYYLFSKPAPIRDSNKNVLDPVGGNRLKNALAKGMASIAKSRETKKSKSESLKEIESFHKPEPHPYFNESHYYNGADLKDDRFITRVSRRGEGGKKSYVFMLLDLKEFGTFFLEQDNVPVDATKDNPNASGVEYTCLDPMKKWRIQYKGELYKGPCVAPAKLKPDAEKIHVELDLVYERDTPVFWYMRDDNKRTLAYNLSQETWNFNFFKYCLTRSKNHGHYEDYGRAKGTIRVGGQERKFDFGTFRDHSWDIRVWQTMDSLFILLYTFKQPLNLFGKDFYYLDLTLVSMPGNLGGVQRYTTGYLLGKNEGEILTCVAATSINDIPWKFLEDGTREPMDRSVLVMQVVPEPNPKNLPPRSLRLTMDGDIRRLRYWPDDGAFEVFEDSMRFECLDEESKVSVEGYGTRQSGFRVGDYDPTKGGCG